MTGYTLNNKQFDNITKSISSIRRVLRSVRAKKSKDSALSREKKLRRQQEKKYYTYKKGEKVIYKNRVAVITKHADGKYQVRQGNPPKLHGGLRARQLKKYN